MPHQHARLAHQKPIRSSTGCANCKIRKVKCDEGKPACLRCHSRHLDCPGYPTNILKWSSKHEVHVAGKTQDNLDIESRSGNARFRALRAAKSIATSNEHDRVPSNTSSSITNPATLTISRNVNAEKSDSTCPSMSTIVINTGQYDSDHQTNRVDCEPHVVAAGRDPAYLNTQNYHDDSFGTTASLMVERYADSFQGLLDIANEETGVAECSTNDLSLHVDPGGSFEDRDMSLRTLISPAGFETRGNRTRTFTSSLSPSLMHVPTVLIEYYFQKVCRECSTFDSSANPFRSRISDMRYKSAPIHYVIQSLAASKLADDMPSMRIVGIEAQGKALQTLKEEFSKVNALHAVSDEVLFTLLLLGMTTSWHAREDLGLAYLHLARQIVAAKAQMLPTAAMPNLDFFQIAIEYWTMIASIVSGDIEFIDRPLIDTFTLVGPRRLSITEKIMPHPWAGVSPRSMQLFGQVLQLIRITRGRAGSKTSSTYSKAGIVGIAKAIATAERLEAECWSVSIPSIDMLQETGDPFTPPIHHVLTAKAYLMSALLQLYMMFPDVLEARIRSAPTSDSISSASMSHSPSDTSAHIMSWSYLWPERSLDHQQDTWVRDIGHRIVECLENIDSRSSTRVVHPPLLLSVASALTLQDEVDTAWHQNVDLTNVHVNQHRFFLISRLETMQAAMRFHAIDNILQVIKEVWRRSDVGRQDIFWMDVMSELRCETIFG